MPDIERFAKFVPLDSGLAVVSVVREGASVHSSIANAGVLDHPLTGEKVVGLVFGGTTRKLMYLRVQQRATVTLRAGWQWMAAEGPVELIGPDDPVPGIDSERLRKLLREIFTAAGGTHEDWDEYDRVMAAERRTAMLLKPERIYGVG
jgi:hypothetical protein